MLNLKIIFFLLASIIDRAGIPLSFLTGLYLLQENKNDMILFLVLSIIMGLLGDIIMYYLGKYYAEKKETNYFTQNAGIRALVIEKSGYITKNPILWIYLCKVFNYINQLIPLALGIKQYPKIKFLIHSLVANIIWFSLFYFISGSWLQFLTVYGKKIGFATGVAGLLVIWGIIKFSEKKVKSKGITN